MRTLAFDGRMGASGDMLLAALLAAGADHDALAPVENADSLDVAYSVGETTKNGIAATTVDVVLTGNGNGSGHDHDGDDHQHTRGDDGDGRGHEHDHTHAEGSGPTRTYAGVVDLVEALGLADEVWVATRATTAAVEPVLLKTLPVEAGVLTVDSGEQLTASVEWFPRALDPDEPGTSITDRPGGGNFDQSAAQFEYVSSSEKAERRRVIAERAYGRGWRS